jgi:FtsP/CotA-like multicopper oxidase with cupredoxin domain
MLTRRDFMLSTAAAVAPVITRAQTPAPAANAPANNQQQTILRLLRRSIEVNGKPALIMGIRQPDGTYGLTTTVNTTFRVRVENQLDVPSLIHWHGLTPPWQQDGVPGVSGPPIAAGGTADYDFPLPFGGTFWMHSHQGLQEQTLLSAPLIIHDGRDRNDQQDIVLMLYDFSFTPSDQIFAELKQKGSASAAASPTPAAQPASAAPMQPMSMGGSTKRDLNDVKYDAFLANDRTLVDPQIIKVEPGGRVLLRVINGSSMSAYHVDLGQLDGQLVAVDGIRIVPVTGRRFPIAVAQRLDIQLALPREAAAYPVLAQLEGERSQTGIILAAGRADIARVPDQAAMPSEPLTLELESRLRAVEPLPPRKVDRTHVLDLTGEMARYVWSINNIVWTPQTPPLPIAAGERVQLVFVNKTMMSHPMHLHGRPFQVVEIDGKPLSGAVRDTVLVPPSSRVAVVFDANNPGYWALHCHLLYHLDAGMFTTLRYI